VSLPSPKAVAISMHTNNNRLEVCFVSPVEGAERFGAALDCAAELVKNIISA
jgi:hypothetical protein